MDMVNSYTYGVQNGRVEQMKEYAEVSELKKDLSALVGNKLIDSNFRQAVSAVIMALERCPKITVCSNCRYLREDDLDNGETYMYCSKRGLSIAPNDFCSFAERK